MSQIDLIHEKHRQVFNKLNELWDHLTKLEAVVEDFSETSLKFADEPIEQVLDKIRSFEPSVSVIGQIKAGKSTLLNALIGETDLLPSDVNPWTSVITALHLNSRNRPQDTRALFRFFDQHEWDRLVATGGRLGETAQRAGFENEVEEVKSQVTQMRQTTEARLGAEFETLIGSSHGYETIEKDIIDRYICYGDPDDLEDGAQQGVYADLTKSADLYIDRPHLPKGLCLRDTPGVNDTFMMREQITLNAISDSRVCVVVLSAHQALSTMDLALLRIICAVEAREVVIFVNRIDELADPAGEQENIRKSINRTLSRIGLSNEIEIIFGSGYWANCALRGDGGMAPASRKSLASLYEGANLDDAETLGRAAMASSGVYPLLAAIAKRVVEGPARAMFNDVDNDLRMLIEMSETVEKVAGNRAGSLNSAAISIDALQAKLDDLNARVLAEFDQKAEQLRADMRTRLERAQHSFTQSALEALQAHIDAFGEIGSWTHDPMGLRMAMKSAFLSTCTKLRREGEIGFDQVLDGIQEILEYDIGVFHESSSVEFPEQPKHTTPTVLARTLSFDLQGSWWRKFWRFGTSRAAEKRYKSIIIAETAPLIDDLISGFFDPAVLRTRDAVQGFTRQQGDFCKAIVEQLSSEAARNDTDEPQLNSLKRLSA